MDKEKFGLILVSAILGTCIIGPLLKLLNLETSNKEAYELVSLTIAIVGALSAVLLWGMCLWDCLDNKKIKSPTLVFAALIFLNWIASIFYYFKFIRRSEKKL